MRAERGAEIRPAAPVQRQRGGVALPFFGAVQKGQLAHRVVALHHGDVAAVKKAPACAQDAERLAQKRLDERPGRRFARVDHNHQVADLAALPRLQRFDQRQVAVGAQAVGIGAQVELVGVEPGLLAHNGEPAQKIPVRPAAAGGFHLGGQRLRAGSLPGLAARLLHAQLGLAAQLFPLPPHHLGGGGPAGRRATGGGCRSKIPAAKPPARRRCARTARCKWARRPAGGRFHAARHRFSAVASPPGAAARRRPRWSSAYSAAISHASPHSAGSRRPRSHGWRNTQCSTLCR